MLVALLLVLGACAQESPSPPASTVDRFGAPPVESPRDVRPLRQDPCAGPLDARGWRELGFEAAGAVQTLMTGDRLCDREGLNGARALSFILVPGRDVLVDTYRVRQFALFRPMTVGPLPATVEQSAPDSISCTVTVGTAENQGFILNHSEYELGSDGQANDPCGRALRVAERIVASLPPLPPK
ncbi:DUF3558 family protein [Actinomycetospora chibensis]|uniref:DUF3558 family protein n=1 Tax=Actinomycetospora chibensis TaxID=663606 RepID=A0ABV9RF99_9PSEU|nr:DUF3558 family protein [Actinomycetospora chibensis]MDD7924156.1 DUF3558 family protein [Actinomycetospora chibensis]